MLTLVVRFTYLALLQIRYVIPDPGSDFFSIDVDPNTNPNPDPRVLGLLDPDPVH